MSDVVICAACRTPIGDFGGSFKTVSASDLVAVAIKEVLIRSGANPDDIDDVIMGDCIQHPNDANTARVALLKAGMPIHVPGVTIQRQCSSAMQAIIFGAQALKANDAKLIIAGGTESMSSAPYVLNNARWGQRLMHGEMTDSMWALLHSGGDMIMGMTAENLAKKYNITREEQDEIALRSHNNAEAATKAGHFKDEMVSVSVPQRKGEPVVVDSDEHIRYGLTMDDLKGLKPVFDKENGTVTAGNSSGLNDAASAVLLTTVEHAKDLGLKPMAKLISNGIAGVEPELMGYGPVPASQKALKKAGMNIGDIELIECNEAFAAQYLSCEKLLGLNRDITNVNGSGIGLGHPVGCTGARIIISLIYEMARRNLTTGLATLCVGGGMGVTTIWERV